MYQTQLYVQNERMQGVIAKGLLDVAKTINADRLIVAVAYATYVGCEVLADLFATHVQRWGEMRKDWVIAFDYGITEDSALQLLEELPNSTVRIPDATELLRNHLRPFRKFHPKLYIFVGERRNEFALFSTSANLTISGLYFNTEHGTTSIWIPPLTKAERQSLRLTKDRYLEVDGLIQRAPRLDDELLQRYKSLRNRRKISTEDDDIVQRFAEADSVQHLRITALLLAARAFWIEVRYVVENRGPGKPGNQIDLQRGSRVFFGFGAGRVPRNTLFGVVFIRHQGEVVECNMRFGNNYMDKLNLPIPDSPGPAAYDNRTLLFERNSDGVFDLKVGTAKEIAEWRMLSIQQGSLFRMRGGREFGVFN